MTRHRGPRDGTPNDADAWVINRGDHWFAYVNARTGNNGRDRIWFNVDSVLEGPRVVRTGTAVPSDADMRAELHRLRSGEGATIFKVKREVQPERFVSRD